MLRAAVLVPLLAGALVTLPGAVAAAPAVADPTPAAAATSSAGPVVVGTVLDQHGRPVPGAPVGGQSVPSTATVTATDGTYSLRLAPGETGVCVDGSHTGGSRFGYVSACRPVSSGSGRVRVTFRLAPGALLIGRVVDAAGAALHDVAVRFANSGPTAATDADGRYALAGVAGGSGSVCGTGAGDHGGGSPTGYLDACTGDQVTAVPGAEVAVPDLVLAQPGGAVRGTVRDGRAGAGLAHVTVSAQPYAGGGAPVTTTTAADGSYVLLGLAPGDEQVCFDGTAGTGGAGRFGYGRQCWRRVDSGAGTANPTPVSVVPGQTRTGIDGALPRLGAVTGVVRRAGGKPAVGARVSVSGGPAGTGGLSVTTDAAGGYEVAVAAGTYAVCVHPADPAPGATGSLDQCVGLTTPGAQVGAPATTRVTANAATRADVTLAAAGRLTGTVVDSAGHPVPGAVVSIQGAPGGATATTDAGGRWVADTGVSGQNGATTGTRLLPGDYSVSISGPSGGGYVAITHPSMSIIGGSGYGTRTPVTVAGGVTTTISDTLRHAGTLTGRVHDAAGAALPYSTVSLVVPGAGDGPVLETAADGTWSQSGLPPGTYHLCTASYATTPAAPASFLSSCPSGPDADGSDVTVVLSEGGTAGVDVTLAAAGGLAGTITSDTGHPLQWSVVEARRGDVVVGTASTQPDGSFEVDRLPPGAYTVCAGGGVDRTDGAPAVQYWAQRCWGATVGGPGSSVPVTGGAVHGGVDLALSLGGDLSGAVHDAAGDALPGATVVVSSTAARYTVQADAWGSWDTLPVAGQYTVCASAPGHTSACYVGPGDTGTASTVPVAVGQAVSGLVLALS